MGQIVCGKRNAEGEKIVAASKKKKKLLRYQPQIDFNVFRQLSAVFSPLDNVVAAVRYARLEVSPN